ncbi:MAG: hypothetical protein JNL10_19895 [Verrucomicrobiales bacterium]|nr:hypothetical protein [Verrucomicrobiales bacterium]
MSPAPVIRVVGVGGAGGKLVQSLVELEPSALASVVDADASVLSRCAGVRTVLVGESIQRGMGCGGDAIQGANLAEADAGRLRELAGASEMLLLVVGLGGGAGSGMAPVVARLARERGALVVVLAAMPFEFEGRLRRSNALQGLGALRTVSDLVIPVPHQGILREVAESARASDLLRCANEFILGVARGLFRMLAGPDLIPLGVADLARVLRGRQVEGGSAAAEASGEHRTRDVWERLVRHPFLASTTPLSDAGAVVLQVAGGPDLAIEELEWLERRAQEASPRAQVLLGAVTHPSLTGSLSALLVVAPETATPTQVPAERDPGTAAESSPGVASRAGALLFEDPPPRSEDRARGGGDRRSAGKGRGAGRGMQQQFDFAPRWRGRFDGVDGTLRDGENLDEPTFARRGVKLN